jgi:hypothetical protein
MTGGSAPKKKRNETKKSVLGIQESVIGQAPWLVRVLLVGRSTSFSTTSTMLD